MGESNAKTFFHIAGGVAFSLYGLVIIVKSISAMKTYFEENANSNGAKK